MTKEVATLKNYSWRNGTRVPKHLAPVFGNRVDDIQSKLGRAPKAREVLEDARDPSSPIHELFNWDDSDAAEKYRAFQASVLLSALTVKIEIVKNGKRDEVDMPVRIVLNRGERGTGGEHEHISDIIADPVRRARMVEMAADDFLSLERKYNNLKEFQNVFKALEEVTQTVIPKLRHEAEKTKSVE